MTDEHGETQRLVAAGLLTPEEGAAIETAEARAKAFAVELKEREELQRLIAKYGIPE